VIVVQRCRFCRVVGREGHLIFAFFLSDDGSFGVCEQQQQQRARRMKCSRKMTMQLQLLLAMRSLPPPL